jgi:hypothetical protein
MRLVARVAAAIAVIGVTIWPGIASAQAWAQYINRDLQFEIMFPGEPMIEEIAFPAPDGTTVPAHRFTATRGEGRYSMIVADFSGNAAGQDPVLDHAAASVRAKGEARYDEITQLNGVPGRALSIVEADGRQILSQMYYWEDRLYFAEGSEAAGRPPPAQFSQSMVITHPDGTGVNINPGGATTREELEALQQQNAAP